MKINRSARGLDTALHKTYHDLFPGERCVPVLDAGARPTQLQHPDPDDPSLPTTSPHLCARPPHETRRLRADAKLQGDPPGESDTN